jgi:conjugative relaxase-like TrwC/TraI family protein
VAQVTIATGFDVDYYLDQVGVDYYLTAAGEPPGIWAGRGAEALGLRGKVGADEASKETMRALFHYGIGPDGVPLATRQRAPKYQARAVYAQIEEAIAKRVAARGRFATPEEKRAIRLQERARGKTATPYYDMTFSAEKSVSLMYAGLLAAARQARDQGDERGAERLRADAERVEAAVMAGADRMLEVAEQRGAIVRTGHHSATSGEYRDAAGFVAVKFLQHTSREDDPQLHVQSTILNKAQRDDKAESGDEKWRALDARPLFRDRLGYAAHAGAAEAQALARLGLPLVKREDGNGFEVGGVGQDTMAAYSSRAAKIEEELAEKLLEYRQIYGRAPDRATLYKLRKQVTVETRKAKAKPKQGGAETEQDRARAAEEALAAWIRKASDARVQELASLREAAEAYALEHPEAVPGQMPGEAERNRISRAAIAEAQRHHSAWTRAHLEWELYRQMPVLPAAADWCAYLNEMADDALTGRIEDAGVIRIAPVPDLVDVSALDHRKDGTSVYRPPGEAKFATTAHIDTEEWILEKASKGAVPQLVTEGQAAAALAGTDLDPQQREAVAGLLTGGRFFSCLVAAAGTGKTHMMASYSKAWAGLTGGRVICLTLSENAARVAAGEGFSAAWNIARFFANKVPVLRGDVLVIDEASQVSTRDLARIASLALQSGARVIGVGDTRQLPAVEAGGLFALIARRLGHWKLTEVRRFEQAWERAASVRLGDGDVMALAEYAARGRIWDGPQDRVYDDAVDLYMTDVARGKQALLLAGSNEEAATLARLVRDRRIERGQITGRREVTLRDGNPAGEGDLVRARLNTRIDAGGRRLTNRDTLRLVRFLGTGDNRIAMAVRQTGPGQWSGTFDVPVSYLTEHAELAYAGNVYTSQGMTVDTSRLIVSESLNREMLYVGMTRGREENTAHTVTGPADPAGTTRAEREAYASEAVARAGELARQGDRAGALAVPRTPPDPDGMRDRAPWEAVLAGVMAKDDPELTALEHIKAAQDFASNSGHLLTLAEAFWWKDVVPKIDQAVKDRIGERAFTRYMQDPERPALLQALRAHEIGGRRIEDSLDAITGRSFDGARSIAAVLHGRLEKEPAPVRGQTQTWAERAPQDAPEAALETAAMLDARQAELGRQVAAQPPPWALEAWGVPPSGPGALREDWERRAGIVESYRETAGITDPQQAIGPVPAGQAQLREAFRSSVVALELPDSEALMRAMGRGQLETQVTAYERAAAIAPPDVSSELASTDRLYKSDIARAAEAREAGRNTQADTAEILAGMTADELATLRVADAARREWAEAHAGEAEAAREAEGELARRDQAERVVRADDAVQERQAQRERDAEFGARLDRMVAEAEGREWTPPEPEAEAEPEAEPEPLSEVEFQEKLSRMVAESEGREYVPPAPAPEPEPGPEPMSDAEFQAQLDQIVRDSQRGPEPEPEPEAGTEPEAAMYAEIHEDLAAIGEGIRELSARMDAEASRRAEAQQEAMLRPAVWQQPEAQAQAEAAAEPAWQPAETQADMDFEAEI